LKKGKKKFLILSSSSNKKDDDDNIKLLMDFLSATEREITRNQLACVLKILCVCVSGCLKLPCDDYSGGTTKESFEPCTRMYAPARYLYCFPFNFSLTHKNMPFVESRQLFIATKDEINLCVCVVEAVKEKQKREVECNREIYKGE
jgi:hypothetical protein